MKWLAGVATLCLALACGLTACGGDGTSSQTPKPRTAMSKAEIARLKEPKVKRPIGPPPTKLLVTDLRKGTGAVVRPDDEILIKDVGVNYRTGVVFETTWGRGERPSRLPLDEVIRGWEEGLPGMRVGGRRKLAVPSRLAYNTGPLIYVIDLLAIE